ncbi:hypothetical protein [Rhizobium favelukesii]|uniref:Uncharacterized protein n=1 Tax=Rhizobium favelukesii TaxID=348824 RepID=W6R828_9HYPH|nr:hypothetical protein [Rhizobium favelukesii]MCS0459281.1 hypothetical protein [Rhizobium favelukesii]CDM57417.1 putative predicted protein [Rhizobium favelukesii]
MARRKKTETVEKTGNETEFDKIMALDAWGLLEYVLANPEFLTDPYYRSFGDVVDARYKQLMSEQPLSQWL